MRARSWVVPLTAGIIGAIAMTSALGPSIVDPRRFEWLMHGDYALHFLGWHLYQHGPWTWPIGGTPLLIWPVGSSIGLTDSIPLLAFVFKPLRAILPAQFQYIGLWLVLSVALQGVFGALLMRIVTPRLSLQLLGAALLMLSPPLLYRINHAALTAHWLVLASLWLTLRSDSLAPSLRLAVGWVLVCAATAATQPYLLLMILVLTSAAHAQQLLFAPRRLLATALSGVAAAAATVLSLWQSGSLMIREEEGLKVGGFGEWSTNLLAFIMPTEAHTLFAPGWFPYHHKEQYEGYAYLGAGMLLLVAMVVVARLISARTPAPPREQLWLRYAPLFLALLFLYAMALGPQITAGPHVVFEYPRSWWRPLHVFRTSGRMVWPVYYTVVILILFAAARLPARRAVVACAIALAVQLIDVAGMVKYLRDVRAFGFRDVLQNRFWDVVPKYYDSIVLVPSNLCTPEGYLDFVPFGLHAGNNHVGINAGVTARFDVVKARKYCQELRREVREGLGTSGALYVLRPDLIAPISEQSKGRVSCTLLDGFGVCFTPDSVARWREPFDIPRSRLPDTAELVRFHDALNGVYRDALGRAANEVAGTTEVRLEALAHYIGYRAEGCDHTEAEAKALPRLTGGGAPSLCAALSLYHAMPAADQTLSFLRRVDDVLRDRRAASAITYVDMEGEAVWVQTYAQQRMHGTREVDARANVLAQVRGSS
jgi:hypothetical protein